jgi:uncharacterized damage-inducible protein DinB
VTIDSSRSDFDGLRDDIRQVYDGDPWYGSPITHVLNGVDATTAARRSFSHAHTIWELVLHMTAWTREVTSRVRGNNAADPLEDWPPQPAPPTESGWRAAQNDLREAHMDFVRAVDALNPADLVPIVTDERQPSGGAPRSIGSHIRGLLQHHTYHLGQIALLKRAAD